ncbi:MAG TPA: hypothetical protein VFZ53_23430 [Polyangiaceae bacterium]
MSDVAVPPEAVDELVLNGDLAGARSALSSVSPNDERYAVARIRLSLAEGSMPAGMAQQALIRLMRRDPDWPGAKELYGEASKAALRSGQSTASHSHPPPPERKG